MSHLAAGGYHYGNRAGPPSNHFNIDAGLVWIGYVMRD